VCNDDIPLDDVHSLIVLYRTNTPVSVQLTLCFVLLRDFFQLGATSSVLYGAQLPALDDKDGETPRRGSGLVMRKITQNLFTQGWVSVCALVDPACPYNTFWSPNFPRCAAPYLRRRKAGLADIVELDKSSIYTHPS
jgi:hypothetical protein